MTYGLKDETIEAVCKVFVSFPELEKVIIYGSRAKGNFKNGSDIELTLIGTEVNLTICNKIELEIDNLLLPYTFDFSIFHHITNKELVSHIERVGKTIYEKISK